MFASLYYYFGLNFGCFGLVVVLLRARWFIKYLMISCEIWVWVWLFYGLMLVGVSCLFCWVACFVELYHLGALVSFDYLGVSVCYVIACLLLLLSLLFVDSGSCLWVIVAAFFGYSFVVGLFGLRLWLSLIFVCFLFVFVVCFILLLLWISDWGGYFGFWGFSGCGELGFSGCGGNWGFPGVGLGGFGVWFSVFCCFRGSFAADRG